VPLTIPPHFSHKDQSDTKSEFVSLQKLRNNGCEWKIWYCIQSAGQEDIP